MCNSPSIRPGGFFSRFVGFRPSRKRFKQDGCVTPSGKVKGPPGVPHPHPPPSQKMLKNYCTKRLNKYEKLNKFEQSSVKMTTGKNGSKNDKQKVQYKSNNNKDDKINKGFCNTFFTLGICAKTLYYHCL
jgi:hypothetical protein